MHRRHFIATATTAAASTAARRVLAAAPSNQINFALIGAGGRGRKIAENLLQVPGTKLAAVCEINPVNVTAARKINPQVKVYEEWGELLAQEKDVQAVLIGLPEHLHSAAAIAAMEAGKDVYCEKPMAYSLEQGRAMIAARDRTGRVLQIGQQRRSNPLYYLAERLLQKEGIIGEIVRADAFWDRYTDWKRPLPDTSKDFSKWGYPTLNHLANWRFYRQYGHGQMTENGTHQLDACGWLLGNRKPKVVCGMGSNLYRDGRETHDIVSAEYMYEGDIIVRFTQDFHQGFNFGWSFGELFLGTEGALRITAQNEIAVYDNQRRETKIPIARLGDIELAGVLSTSSELTAAETERKRGLAGYGDVNAMRIFVNCIQKRTSPTCTAEIGLNSIVPTIIGTEAQFAAEHRKFTKEMFA